MYVPTTDITLIYRLVITNYNMNWSTVNEYWTNVSGNLSFLGGKGQKNQESPYLNNFMDGVNTSVTPLSVVQLQTILKPVLCGLVMTLLFGGWRFWLELVLWYQIYADYHSRESKPFTIYTLVVKCLAARILTLVIWIWQQEMLVDFFLAEMIFDLFFDPLFFNYWIYELKLVNNKRKFSKRIDYFQSRLAFFIGYGLIITILIWLDFYQTLLFSYAVCLICYETPQPEDGKASPPPKYVTYIPGYKNEDPDVDFGVYLEKFLRMVDPHVKNFVTKTKLKSHWEEIVDKAQPYVTQQLSSFQERFGNAEWILACLTPPQQKSNGGGPADRDNDEHEKKD